MRKLKTADIPAFCRCLKNSGIKGFIRATAKTADNVKDIWDNGFEILWGLFELMTEQPAELELYQFLAGPFETTPEKLAAMDMADFLSGIKQLVKENDLDSFFKFAAESMK
ncbi:MAG: hypothetical protein PUF71_02930 [Firmicutes bacterium]|nr:hypothetical protein [Bacillota bacterium]